MATETLERRKTNLISKIKKIADETALREIENTVEIVESRPTEKQLKMLEKLAKPIREKTDIEQIIKEQNWTGVDRERFNEIIKKFNWQISDEDFLRILREI